MRSVSRFQSAVMLSLLLFHNPAENVHIYDQLAFTCFFAILVVV